MMDIWRRFPEGEMACQRRFEYSNGETAKRYAGVDRRASTTQPRTLKMTSPGGTEIAVLDWLDSQRSAMVDLIRALVDIDSGSYDKAGVDAVGARLRAFLAEQGVALAVIPNDRFGDAIRAEVNNQADTTRGAGSNSPVLLLGHRDTVFPAGEAGRRPFRIVDGRGAGPGCCDMKAGVVINAFVLAAFARFAAAPAPIAALFTADEEIGSPSSKALIKEAARSARAVFNSEPGRPGGGVVTGRKGGRFMRLDIVGKAAHAGNNLTDGISAIEELARKIVKLHALTDLSAGISCNVGTVGGGQTVNTVAPNATAEIDLRYIEPEHGARAFAAVEAIVAEANVPGTTASLEITGEFEPLVASDASRRLFEHYAACARSLGQTVEGMFAGGCADSGFAASAGAPTICAVGPVGGRAHSPDEYLEIDTIVPRAQALALAIMRLDAV
jgi:glutamate carboxypeptidase